VGPRDGKHICRQRHGMGGSAAALATALLRPAAGEMLKSGVLLGACLVIIMASLTKTQPYVLKCIS